MLKALSLTREAFTSTWIPGHQHQASREHGGANAYTFFLGQTADRPLIEAIRSVYGGYVCVLDERLADDVHGEPLTFHHVHSRVFEAAWATVIACKGDGGWVACDLSWELYIVLRNLGLCTYHVEPTIRQV